MDINKLVGIIPDNILSTLTPDFLSNADIDGPKRLSNFLGQTEEESGKFTQEVENLNYSAQALQDLFSKHFPNDDEANYARQQERIANRIYANRNGNGDETSGDGWKYRGRGRLQITFYDNYKAFQDWLATKGIVVDLINNPDIVEEAPYDLLSAAWFFTSHNLWAICDKGCDMATVTIITEHINGGTNGLQLRYRYTQQIYTALTS